jgi:peptidylprolyl isomerase
MSIFHAGATMPRHARLVLLVVSLNLAAPAAAREAIARMGDISLDMNEVRLLVEAQPEARDARELERLVRAELLRRGVAAEARKQGYDNTPEVAARMRQAADQVLATAYMNSVARPPAEYPSAELVRQAYEANREALMQPRRYRLSQIYLAGLDDKARKQAEEVMRAVRRRGADFAALARKHSQHATSATRGGDMDWLREAELIPAMREALKDQGKGNILGPLKGAEGWHILKIDDVRQPEVLPFEEAREALTRNLRLRRAAELEAAHLDALLARSPITVNGIALEALRKP